MILLSRLIYLALLVGKKDKNTNSIFLFDLNVFLPTEDDDPGTCPT